MKSFSLEKALNNMEPNHSLSQHCQVDAEIMGSFVFLIQSEGAPKLHLGFSPAMSTELLGQQLL